jgi:hypothetical protein
MRLMKHAFVKITGLISTTLIIIVFVVVCGVIFRSTPRAAKSQPKRIVIAASTLLDG